MTTSNKEDRLITKKICYILLAISVHWEWNTPGIIHGRCIWLSA